MLPPFAQDIGTSLYGLRLRKSMLGKEYREFYNAIEKNQFFTNIQSKRYQEENLVNFLKFSLLNVPYYRKLASKLNLSVDKINSAEDISKFPILDKETLRAHLKDFTSEPFNNPKAKVVMKHTSGTTGKGLHITLSRECQQIEYAFRNLHMSWAGIYPGMKIAFFAGHPVANPTNTEPPFWARDLVNNSLYFSSQHISPKNMASYLSRLNKYNPDLLIGYPSSIYLIALGIIESNLKSIRPHAVFTSSETLLEYQKDAIRDAFACKIFNYYGNAERVGCIMECEYGNLHVQSEYSYIEFINQNGSKASSGEIGEMICTGYRNKAMPLIRYCVGDLAIPSDNECPCGREGIIVDKIIGRVEDIIITPEGKHVGRLDHLFKDMLNVKEAQIVQESIESVTINIVKRNGFNSSDLQLLKQEARLRLGSEIKLIFKFVDNLNRDRSGKLRFVISNVSSSFKKLKQPGEYNLLTLEKKEENPVFNAICNI